MKISHQFIIILSIIALILPSFSFAQVNERVQPPETLKDVQELFQKATRPFFEGVLKAWQKALSTWQKMVDFFKNIWRLKVKPSFQNIWEKVFSLFEK